MSDDVETDWVCKCVVCSSSMKSVIVQITGNDGGRMCIETHLALFRATRLTTCNHRIALTVCERQSRFFSISYKRSGVAVIQKSRFKNAVGLHEIMKMW